MKKIQEFVWIAVHSHIILLKILANNVTTAVYIAPRVNVFSVMVRVFLLKINV